VRVIVLLKSPLQNPKARGPLHSLGPHDRAALNTGLQLVQQGVCGEDDLVALTAGPPEDEVALTAAVQAGVKRAIRLTDPILARSDLRMMGVVLSTALRKLSFDLVLTGNRSVNWGSGGTGPAVAHVLRLTHVTSVVAVDAEKDQPTGNGEPSNPRLLVTHRREGRLVNLRVTLPALLAIAAGPPMSLPEPGPEQKTPAVEALSLADMTLPFKQPRAVDELDGADRKPPPQQLTKLAALADLLKRSRRGRG
jgi:electron transfer flavoprotein beta subunit